MVQQYQLTGMTCSSCEAKVKTALLALPEVSKVEVSKEDNSATLTMSQPMAVHDLQAVLDDKYQISSSAHIVGDDQRSWLSTYKPILLVFAYITGVTLLIQSMNNQFDVMQWMRHFMAGFFLVFSFFKLINLKGFAESYIMYDVVARRFPAWSYIYAFIELALGIAFLININPIATNLVTTLVMTISLIGVLQSVLNKKKIQCACLGAVFDLPMSTVTIIEDGLMIIMSASMLYLYLG